MPALPILIGLFDKRIVNALLYGLTAAILLLAFLVGAFGILFIESLFMKDEIQIMIHCLVK
ncbi:MAG: hypothetical protein CBC48_00500 [bacterium TMED88]|nr:MAG: hypothetical protein CBC48_00500 [bacterium TMED88]